MKYDNFKDILKHTHGLGFLETVRLRGADDTTYVESVAEDRSVVLYGRLNHELEDFSGKTVGLARLGILAGCINFPAFKEPGATLEVVTQERAGETIPSEIEFKSATGHTANYRFMSEQAAAEKVKIPKFNGAKWDIVYKPTKKNLTDLAYFSNMLGSYEPTFSIMLKNKKLQLSVGAQGGDRSMVPFADDVQGTYSSGWRWPLVNVLSILKLSDGADVTMNVSSAGALKLEVTSGLGTYEYILSARA